MWRRTGAQRGELAGLCLQELAQLAAQSQPEAATDPQARGAAGDGGSAESHLTGRPRNRDDGGDAETKAEAQEVDFQRMAATLRDRLYPELENCVPPFDLTAKLLWQAGLRQPMWILPIGRGSAQSQTLEVVAIPRSATMCAI
jgi:hypothetical protein